MFRPLLNKLDSINESTSTILLGYIDEFADGDVWLIKAPREIAKTFMTLANNIEDESTKGTEYDPETGIMGQVHTELDDSDPPQWKPVTSSIPENILTDLESIRPINNTVIDRLKKVDGNIQEFMSEFLWDLENARFALVVSNEANYVGNSISFQNRNSMN